MDLLIDQEDAQGLVFRVPRLVLVKNGTGETREAGALMGFDISLLHGARNHRSKNRDSAYYIVGDPERTGPCCILVCNLLPGGVGQACVRGRTLLRDGREESPGEPIRQAPRGRVLGWFEGYVGDGLHQVAFDGIYGMG